MIYGVKAAEIDSVHGSRARAWVDGEVPFPRQPEAIAVGRGWSSQTMGLHGGGGLWRGGTVGGHGGVGLDLTVHMDTLLSLQCVHMFMAFLYRFS